MIAGHVKEQHPNGGLTSGDGGVMNVDDVLQELGSAMQ